MHHAQYPILPNVRKEKHDPKSREKASNRNKRQTNMEDRNKTASFPSFHESLHKNTQRLYTNLRELQNVFSKITRPVYKIQS